LFSFERRSTKQLAFSLLRSRATTLPLADYGEGDQKVHMTPDHSKTNGSAKAESAEERSRWMTSLEIRFAEAEPSLGVSRQRLIREILDPSENTYFLSSRAGQKVWA
jgi:hypothetical protein